MGESLTDDFQNEINSVEQVLQMVISPDRPAEVKSERQYQILESVQAGAKSYGRGVLVEDETGRLAQVTDFRLIKDSTRYGREDSTVRKPKVQTNPEFTLSYADGTQRVTMKPPKTLSIDWQALPLDEHDPFYEMTYVEIRGHRFQVGELVSFGSQVGTVTVINPDKQTLAIGAREVFEKETPYHLYQVNINDIDYIVRDNGDIKRNPDKTTFKPSLG